jgi:hypothetical protein
MSSSVSQTRLELSPASSTRLEYVYVFSVSTLAHCLQCFICIWDSCTSFLVSHTCLCFRVSNWDPYGPSLSGRCQGICLPASYIYVDAVCRIFLFWLSCFFVGLTPSTHHVGVLSRFDAVMNRFNNGGYMRLDINSVGHSYRGTTPTVLVYTPRLPKGNLQGRQKYKNQLHRNSLPDQSRFCMRLTWEP